jgi:hypothetical protein
MSDNLEGWTSCMSWMDDGDYRSGTVEMMNSPNTIVAYVKSNNNTLSWGADHQWNSKKWRTLIVVTPELMTTVKNYPYNNNEFSKVCLQLLKDLAVKNLPEWEYQDAVPEVKDEQYHNNISINFETYTMYNDFNHVDENVMMFSNKFYSLTGPYWITYSGEMSCMWCGSVFDASDVEDTESYVIGSCCQDFPTHQEQCDCCWDWYDEEELEWVSGDRLCSACVEEHCVTCAISNNVRYVNDMVTVYLASTPNAPNEATDYSVPIHDIFLSPDTPANRYGWYVDRYSRIPRYDEDQEIYYWNYEDLTDYGLRDIYGISR